jgi:hypothetical protein
MQIQLPFDARADSSIQPPPVWPAPSVLEPAPSLVFVRHPRARRYILRLTDHDEVRVTIPRWGSRKEARAFAERERLWIEKERAKWLRRRDGRHGREEQDPEERRRGFEKARRELPARLIELAARFELTVAKISIRNQKWRWGSCSRAAHICLNWRLVLLPEAVRDYVLIHELMHLKRMDHSPRFWKLVEQACPEYRELRRQLRASRLG